MSNADQPVDRNLDADRRPPEPEREAGEAGQSPSEPGDMMPWTVEEGGGFEEAGTGAAEAQKFHVATAAEPVSGGAAVPQPSDATAEREDSRAGVSKSRYVVTPAEPVSTPGAEKRGPKKPGGKRRLRGPVMVGSAVVLVALGAVGYMGLPLAGKQGPGGNSEEANADRVPSPPGQNLPAQQPVAQQPVAQQPVAQQPAGQQTPVPVVEKVAGVELFDAKRLSGSLLAEDKEKINELRGKILTDPSISQADLQRISAWVNSGVGESSGAEVKELLFLVQMIRGEVGDVVAGRPESGKTPPSTNKGASRGARLGDGLAQLGIIGARPTSLRSLWFMSMTGTLQADEQASEGPRGAKPQPAADNAPPPGLNPRGLAMWKVAQETIAEKRATASRRAAAYRMLAQLCVESGDFRRADQYSRQAQQILVETPRAGLTPEERANLDAETGLVAQVSRQARTAAQVEDAAKRAADAADEAKKSVKDVQSLVTSAKSDVAAVRNDLEAIQKLAKGQMPPGKSDAEARKDREAMEKAAEEAKARAVATKADADAARKDREAAQKSLEEAKAHAAAAKNDAQLAQKARREVQMGTGSVPADVVTKVELARAVEDLKKDASAARKSAEQTSANLGQFQSQADEQRRSVVDALKSLREEVAKLASGPVGKGITAEQLERIVGEVANRVSAAAAQYDWQSPVALRGPLGRIRQWYYPPAPPSRVPQVTARPTEAAPQASTEGAGGTAPAQVPGKPAQPPASAATQQLVDAKLKILGEPASQEPNPLMAGEIFSRGASAYFLGETEEALDYFVAAIRQDPKNALYRYYLGLTLRRLGRPLEAEVQVRAGRRLESPTWRYGIGSSLQRVQGPDRDWLERLRLEM